MNFPADMQLAPLTSLAEVNPARSVNHLSPDTEVSFISMGDVSESGRIVSIQTRRYSEVRQGFTAFAEGDVLFAKITPCMENGKGCIAVGLTNAKGFGSTEFHVLRANSEGDPGFIYQWSTSKELRIEAKNSMTGSAGQQRVPSDFFSKFLIPRFPKPEQTKIAEILSTVDRAIEQTEALIAKQERIKTGLMQDLLTRGIDEHGVIRTIQPGKGRSTIFGTLPQEWDLLPANELCLSIIDCKNRTPPSTAEGHAVIRTPNVRSGKYIFDEQAYTDSHSYKVWTSRGEPAVGDIVITREAPFGEACMIPEMPLPPCLGQRMMLYRTNPNRLRSDFLLYALYSSSVQGHLLEMAGGSTVGHVRVNDIRTLPIPHPKDTKEQNQIAQILGQADNALDDFSNTRSKLLVLKTALMQDLLTGRKRVTPLLEMEETH